MRNTIHQGDCLAEMRKLPDNSVDAVVTDPPYGLSFMGKKWDYDVPSQEIWEECLRLLKPGGYLLAFAGTRTQHRMAVRIEDAGFEIRDMIAWIYGSGFPKSLDIGKAVDKLQGNEREVVGEGKWNNRKPNGSLSDNSVGLTTQVDFKDTKGTSEWEGWGTALKPALEPITVARKPLSESTVAKNVLKWGTGGLDIDGSRVPTEEDRSRKGGGDPGMWSGKKQITSESHLGGRFPANLIIDGSEEVVSLFPNSSGGAFPKKSNIPTGQHYEGGWGAVDNGIRTEMGGGSAARFFYCAKASKSERNAGCDNLEEKETKRYGDFKGTSEHAPKLDVKNTNFHPTVKPVALMEYLIGLVSRKGSVILDPFGGSGTTAIACLNKNRDYILMEKDPEYFKIIESRIASRLQQMKPVVKAQLSIFPDAD